MDLTNSAKCDVIQQMPGIQRTGGRTLEMDSDCYADLFNAIHGVASMGRLA